MMSMHDGGHSLRLTLAQKPRRKRLHKDGGQKTRSKESNSLGDFSDPHGDDFELSRPSFRSVSEATERPEETLLRVNQN
jgi:hypothetical protein